MPEAFIGIDVIVGFPGETNEEFETTYNFLSNLKPAFLHIFPYSKRADTPAASYDDQVHDSDKTARVERLTQQSDRLHTEFCDQFKGTAEEVLFESTQRGGKMFGYTRNYIKVEKPFDKEQIGKIVKVLL